jgi:hypothetical protein
MVTIQKNATNDLLGQREDVLSIAKRIRVMVKGGDKLSDNEAMALAQVSLVTRLNPFIGEVWYIPGKGPMVGIAGSRRYNNEQVETKGGYSSAEFLSVSPEEAGVPAEVIKDVEAAWKCTITDSIATTQYLKMLTDTINTLHAAGSKDAFGDAKEVVGNKPTWIGYGYSTKSETSRMNKQQLAKKRAEADALKKKIIIPFGGDVSTEDIAPSYVEGTVENLPHEMADPVDEVFPDKTQHHFNSEEIVEVVRSGMNYDKETALQTLKEAHSKKRIADTLTIDEVRIFVKELLGIS